MNIFTTLSPIMIYINIIYIHRTQKSDRTLKSNDHTMFDGLGVPMFDYLTHQSPKVCGGVTKVQCSKQ